MHIKVRTVFVLVCASFAISLAAIAQPSALPVAPRMPTTPPPAVPVAPAPTPQPMANPADLSTNIIAWDSLDKAVTSTYGDEFAKFSFSLTNISQEPVTIVNVHTSCGCTTAQLPPMPWTLKPGEYGTIHVNLNLASKGGTVIKSVSVASTLGTKQLLVRTTILPLPSTTAMAPGSREQNMMLSRADHQAVFKGDCASCHAEPAKGLAGKELYTAVCGICHDASHRASAVPDLHVAKQERNADFWRNWITNGKVGSMMPAFALPAGGILTDEQITSLVEYLEKTMPAKPAPATASAAH
jgi:mono/diheme cytochrome c family protein